MDRNQSLGDVHDDQMAVLALLSQKCNKLEYRIADLERQLLFLRMVGLVALMGIIIFKL